MLSTPLGVPTPLPSEEQITPAVSVKPDLVHAVYKTHFSRDFACIAIIVGIKYMCKFQEGSQLFIPPYHHHWLPYNDGSSKRVVEVFDVIQTTGINC